jgi:hypothetical protein
MECPDFVGAIDDKVERERENTDRELGSVSKKSKKNSRNTTCCEDKQVRALNKDVTALGTA